VAHQMQLGQAPGLNMSRINLELHEFCNGNNYFSSPPEGANGVYAVRPDASEYVVHHPFVLSLSHTHADLLLLEKPLLSAPLQLDLRQQQTQGTLTAGRCGSSTSLRTAD
jgi:hypothetical protein